MLRAALLGQLSSKKVTTITNKTPLDVKQEHFLVYLQDQQVSEPQGQK